MPMTYFIRMVLDALELVFVSTPWIVDRGADCPADLADRRGAHGDLLQRIPGLHGAAWGSGRKAMTTLALLGTAACLSILIGIPLGMFARAVGPGFIPSSSRSWTSCKPCPLSSS